MFGHVLPAGRANAHRRHAGNRQFGRVVRLGVDIQIDRRPAGQFRLHFRRLDGRRQLPAVGRPLRPHANQDRLAIGQRAAIAVVQARRPRDRLDVSFVACCSATPLARRGRGTGGEGFLGRRRLLRGFVFRFRRDRLQRKQRAAYQQEDQSCRYGEVHICSHSIRGATRRPLTVFLARLLKINFQRLDRRGELAAVGRPLRSHADEERLAIGQRGDIRRSGSKATGPRFARLSRRRRAALPSPPRERGRGEGFVFDAGSSPFVFRFRAIACTAIAVPHASATIHRRAVVTFIGRSPSLSARDESSPNTCRSRTSGCSRGRGRRCSSPSPGRNRGVCTAESATWACEGP